MGFPLRLGVAALAIDRFAPILLVIRLKLKLELSLKYNRNMLFSIMLEEPGPKA